MTAYSEVLVYRVSLAGLSLLTSILFVPLARELGRRKFLEQLVSPDACFKLTV